YLHSSYTAIISVSSVSLHDALPIWVVTPGYFDTLGIPLVAGRPFGIEDRADAVDRVAAVNEAVARRFWPEGNAIGGRLRLMLRGDRKSTRLNSSHVKISYAVFCLKK